MIAGAGIAIIYDYAWSVLIFIIIGTPGYLVNSQRQGSVAGDP